VLLARGLLILVMGIGSIAMWLIVPIGWLFLASRLATGTQATLGLIVMVLVGIPISMVVIGKGLAALNRYYGRVTGTSTTTRAQLPWQRSMRGERGSTRQTTVLDIVMVVSVAFALLAFGFWFFVLAGSSLPS
jgi:hypothetical protein